jgi:hypothetical protein
MSRPSRVSALLRPAALQQVQDSGLAVAALVVSICSAAVTLGALAWHFALYRLQGARLKVQLLFRFRSDSGMTTTVHEGWKAPEWDRLNGARRMGHVGIEYGLIRVTNIGRTPVSVEAIGLDLGRLQRFRRGRLMITPMQFSDPDDKAWKAVDLKHPRFHAHLVTCDRCAFRRAVERSTWPRPLRAGVARGGA